MNREYGLPLLTRRLGNSADELAMNSTLDSSGGGSKYSVRWSPPSVAVVKGDAPQPRYFSASTVSDGPTSPPSTRRHSPRIQSSPAPAPAGARLGSPSCTLSPGEQRGSGSPGLRLQRDAPPPWNSVLGSSSFQDASGDGSMDRMAGSELRRAVRDQTVGGPVARREAIAAIDTYMTSHCARHVHEPHRNANFRKSLADMGAAAPALAPLLQLVIRYMREQSELMQNVQQTHKDEMLMREKELYKKFDSFFEEKIFGILKDKKMAEAQSQRLEQEAFELRRARDDELMKTKADLISRMNECERREDEFRAFRKLIANVFQNNEKLNNRIEELEDIMRKHRLEVPPPLQLTNNDGSRVDQKRKNNSNVPQPPPAYVRHISSQVSPEFIKASAEEMSAARLNLQKELLNCAFDERTAYRLEISKLKGDNADLRLYIEQLEKTVTELHCYIHEKRFLSTDEYGQVPLTPRPRDIPFSIQTELGIDLKKHTGEIMAEIGAVAISLKHQLNSALLRLRQMITVSEWMQEDTLVQLDELHNGSGALATHSVSSWSSIPHFLRTHIYPDVPNLRWTEADAGAIFLEFFKNYKEMRRACIRYRDKKMVQPRVLQMFERRAANLSILDSPITQMTRNERAVPFGYVVSHFIRQYLCNITPGIGTQQLTLPGTLNPTYHANGEDKIVELEFARFAYNLWWAAHRYRDTQPLCQLFVQVAHGKLPIELFDIMNGSIAFVESCVKRLDMDGSRTFTYSKLIHGVLRIVDDLGVEAGRSAILACVQTFEENEAPIFGGRITTVALLANESHILEEKPISEVKQSASHLPPRITALRIARKSQQPPGASVFLRYWRRLVMRQYEAEFSALESLLEPLVVESEVVFGLYLLPIPEALARIDNYDRPDEPETNATNGVQDDPTLGVGREREGSESENTGNEAYSALLRAQREIFYNRLTTRKRLMLAVFNELIDDIPRLNRSVHFPFSAEQRQTPKEERETESVPAPRGHSSSKHKKRRRSKARRSTAAVCEDFIVTSDKEIIEWYGFCHALRQKVLPLSGKIFVNTAVSDPAEWLLPTEDDEPGSPPAGSGKFAEKESSPNNNNTVHAHLIIENDHQKPA